MAKKILFINQETEPYVEGTLLARMGKRLPEKMQRLGWEIRTFMPKWGSINERRGQLHEVIRLSGVNIVVNENDHPLMIKVASLPVSRVQVYFIENEEYFSRREIPPAEGDTLPMTNGEKAIFFARGVLETVKKLRWAPDVIVCQGWVSSIVPLYVKTVYADEPWLADAHVVTNLYEDEGGFDGLLGESFKHAMVYKEATAEVLAPYKDQFDWDELARLARDFSDDVVEVTSEESVNAICNMIVEKTSR